jgi:lipopolysaccharide/colanic/teichoic acid biosynthesis glycosyltransferase
VPGYADRLQGDDRRILELYPGITGPATLKFRDEETLFAQAPDPQRYNDDIIFPEKVRLNLEYMDHWSFWKDIGYIIMTILPGFTRKVGLDRKLGLAGNGS